MFTTPEQLAYEAQQRAKLQAHEDAKDEHFRRLNNPLVGGHRGPAGAAGNGNGRATQPAGCG